MSINKKEITHPENQEKFSTGAYSSGLAIDGWLYVSGQGPVDYKTSTFSLGTLEHETRLVMHNIKRILEVGGCSLNDVVKCTVHLADINDFEEYNKIYASYFPGTKPARTTVQSVLAKGMKVEIDAIARIPQND